MRTPARAVLGGLLLGAAERDPDREAIAFPDHSLTYRDFADYSRNIARSMLANGIRSGDHVGILATNRPEFLPILFACTLVGAVAVLLNARFRTQELRHVVRHCDLTWIILGNLNAAPHAARLMAAFPDLNDPSSEDSLAGDVSPQLTRLVALDPTAKGPFQDWSDFMSEASNVTEAQLDSVIENVDPLNTALIMFTSGTTAMPKGCVLTHQSVFLTSDAMRNRLSLVKEDVMWNPLPMFHMASIIPLLSLMHVGGKFLTDTAVNIDRAVRQIHQEQATFLYPAFPAIMSDLLAHPEFEPEQLNCVRLVNNVAHAEVLQANMAAMPLATHVSAYGMTELSGITSHNDPGDPAEERLRNCGLPYPGIEVSIQDTDTGAICDQGQQGEICVRGFSVFSGYYRQPEENDKAFDAEGWFHTGDLGLLDEKGRICFRGRLKDLLKVGGENVSPLEIEAWLSTHPDIIMAQVIGAPDRRLDEVPAAFIELNPTARVSEQDIIDYCTGQIASFKVPKIVRFVTEWPMSATKIQKGELRKLLD